MVSKRSRFVLLACILAVLCFLTFFQTQLEPMRLFQDPGRTYRYVYKNLVGLNNVVFNTNKSAFLTVLETFDWENFIEATKNKIDPVLDDSREELIQLIQDYVIMEPLVPIDESCVAPVLTSPEELDCSWSGYGTAFTGSLNKKIPKIGILVQFGFDVDVLEIYLNEVYDVVDYFFILESTKSHFRTLSKSLMWEKVKDQPRFDKFADKIVHLIVDDADNAPGAHTLKKGNYTGIFVVETMQEYRRWMKLLEWNAWNKVFENDDLLGFGDADEIPARKMVHMLKHCATKGESVDVGIWFPFGNIHKAFATDHPVPGHKYTLGDPTFFTWKSAKAYYKRNERKKIPTRMRGTSKQYILGGMHMTQYGYLPFALTKRLTCTECGHWPVKEVEAFVEKMQTNKIRELELEYAAVPLMHQCRIVTLSSIEDEMKEIAILPWFYDCNRDRYPVWEGKHDTRLD